VRTGVTAILPNPSNVFEQRVVGGGFILNGAGEVSGMTQLMEWGLIETPIFLTNTLSVGAVSDAAVKWMVEKFPGIGGEHDVIIPLVGECDDSWLNDIAGRHVKEQHVNEAISTASDGPVAEGNVGGGTGMITCDFKAGIGTSSRRLPESLGGYTVGVLVMSNFGVMRQLRVGGLPVGEMLEERYGSLPRREHSYGSIIAVIATDAPLISHQLNRVAKRAALGIGRVGSSAMHGSGEIVLAFSTANMVPRETRKISHEDPARPAPRPLVRGGDRGHRGGHPERPLRRPRHGRREREPLEGASHRRGEGDGRSLATASRGSPARRRGGEEGTPCSCSCRRGRTARGRPGRDDRAGASHRGSRRRGHGSACSASAFAWRRSP